MFLHDQRPVAQPDPRVRLLLDGGPVWLLASSERGRLQSLLGALGLTIFLGHWRAPEEVPVRRGLFIFVRAAARVIPGGLFYSPIVSLTDRPHWIAVALSG